MSGGQDSNNWYCIKHGKSFYEDEICPQCKEEKTLRYNIVKDFAAGMTWRELTTKYEMTSEDIENKLRDFLSRYVKLVGRMY